MNNYAFDKLYFYFRLRFFHVSFVIVIEDRQNEGSLWNE